MTKSFQYSAGRRAVIVSLFATVAGGALANSSLAGRSSDYPLVQVFKTPTCGCCSAWVEHIVNAGFHVKTNDVPDEDLQNLKQKYGIPPAYASCHTAIMSDYVIEGHVPADDIKKMLEARPQIIGLTVPGMPMGSPGMEMGDHREEYATFQIARDGSVSIFTMHR